MLVWVIVVSVAAILLLVVVARIDVGARRRGRRTGINKSKMTESKMRARQTHRDTGGPW
jgi:beta-lactamase regulating signal transducer with metallopeptidase domain